jgi:hypothetical protein
MSELEIHVCPETGICSIRKGGTKVDLMPDEAEAIRGAANDPQKIQEIIAGCDSSLSGILSVADLKQISKDV